MLPERSAPHSPRIILHYNWSGRTRAGTRPHPRRDSAPIRCGRSSSWGSARRRRRGSAARRTRCCSRSFRCALPGPAPVPGHRECWASASAGPAPGQRRCRASASAGPVPGRCRDVAAVPLGECSRHQKAAKLRVPLRVPFEYPFECCRCTSTGAGGRWITRRSSASRSASRCRQAVAARFLFGNFRPGGSSQALIVERTPSDRRGAIFNFKDIADYSALLQCAAAHTPTQTNTM